MSNKHGMPYEDVRKRLKRIQKTDGNEQLKSNLTKSLKGQVSRRDGDEAVKELNKELSMNTLGHSGRYLRSCGYGQPKRGKLEGWEEIAPGHYRREYA